MQPREPQATLDFHGRPGLTMQAVKKEVEAFVAKALEAGHVRLRIVTGKGLHSGARGPLVRPQVERTLNALQRAGKVRMFHGERLDQGGDGAFRVDL